jgi:hypothetical protein
MTDEQINEAIALYLGWRGVVSDPILGVMGVPPVGNECDIPRIKNAMWTKDLNAMHEAEKTLADANMYVMEYHIKAMVKGHGFYFHATARQRAEAFLRTLGKWEDR